MEAVSNLPEQSGQVMLDRLPDRLEIHLEVPVRHGIAHRVGRGQWQLGVRGGELGEAPEDVVAGLTDDLDVADHRVLRDVASVELHFAQIRRIPLDPLDGVDNVAELFRHGPPAHVGTASAIT